MNPFDTKRLPVYNLAYLKRIFEFGFPKGKTQTEFK